MSKKAVMTNSLSRRIAEEAQLLAEERWIINTLRKIKKQRNSLQIERFHLESLKLQLNTNIKKPDSEKSHLEPTTSAVDLMKSATVNTSMFSAPNEEEALCNAEELNLTVTDSVFNKEQLTYNMDQDQEEEEKDDEDLLIDMNMFMYGS